MNREHVCRAWGIAAPLPGWDESRGVKAELAKAQDLRPDYLAPESLCLKGTES